MYIFDHDTHSPTASRFSLKTRQLNKLTPPAYTEKCPALIEFQNYILIGLLLNNSKCQIYDPFSDSYTSLNPFVNEHTSMVFVKNNDRAYMILSNDKIYESGYKDIFSWRLISVILLIDLFDPGAAFQRYNNEIYCQKGKGVYKFNLKQKTLRFLKWIDRE